MVLPCLRGTRETQRRSCKAFLDQTLSPKKEAISCGRAGDNRGACQTFGMGVGQVL